MTTITCIVTTLGLSLTFNYTDKPVTKQTNDSTFHFVAIDSIDNYWSVRDTEGREVTFFPECRIEEAKDD